MKLGEITQAKIIRWGLGAALLLFVIGLCVNPSAANDLFWQLRMGQDILTTHQLPYGDAYSWTRRGTPYVLHEWLAFILLKKAYDVSGGFAGIWLLQTSLLIGAFALLYRFLLQETEDAPLTACFLAVAAAIASCAFFQPRPHLFTYLLVPAVVGLILTVRRNPNRWKSLWWLLPLFLLWSNLHAGVLLGLLIMMVFVVGDGIDAYGRTSEHEAHRSEKKVEVRRLAWFTLACALATLVNPYGWKIYHNLAMTVSNGTAMNAVMEWFSPDFHQQSGKILEGIAVLIIAGLACSRQKRDTASVLITLALLHASLTAYRNVPLFALIGILLNARHIQSTLTLLTAQEHATGMSLFGRKPDARLVPVLLLLFGFLAVLRLERGAITARPKAGNGLETVARHSIALRSFPERACRFMETEHFPTTLKLFNDYNYGGFLIWRLPQFAVFVDGRADIYFGKLLEDYITIHDMKEDWHRVLSSYPADVAILAAKSPEAHLFASVPEWTLVYADEPETGTHARLPEEENTLIFVRVLPKYVDLIARCRRDCDALTPVVVTLRH